VQDDSKLRGLGSAYRPSVDSSLGLREKQGRRSWIAGHRH